MSETRISGASAFSFNVILLFADSFERWCGKSLVPAMGVGMITMVIIMCHYLVFGILFFVNLFNHGRQCEMSVRFVDFVCMEEVAIRFVETSVVEVWQVARVEFSNVATEFAHDTCSKKRNANKQWKKKATMERVFIAGWCGAQLRACAVSAREKDRVGATLRQFFVPQQ